MQRDHELYSLCQSRPCSADPYAHSKRAVDLVSREINTRMNQKGIYSSTTCPGLVATQLTYGIMPQWFWSLILPLLLLLRICLPSMTMTAASGAEALLWLARQQPSSIDHTHKYLSRASVSGRRYVDTEQIRGSEELSAEVWKQLETLSRTLSSS
jgi:17beta-estradiol 17-dehydrogenase/3beta-hydroxysteroid 3-dehydrogenase